MCWLPSNSHDTKPYHLSDALRNQLDIHYDDFQVLKHFPEQYLVIFNNPRDRHTTTETFLAAGGLAFPQRANESASAERSW